MKLATGFRPLPPRSPLCLSLRLDTREEITDGAQELLGLLDVAHVGALLEVVRLRAGDAAMNGLVDRRGRLVVPTGEDERGDANLAKAGGDVPRLSACR